MKITVKWADMFNNDSETIVLTGSLAQRFKSATYKTSIITQLETVSKNARILDWYVSKR